MEWIEEYVEIDFKYWYVLYFWGFYFGDEIFFVTMFDFVKVVWKLFDVCGDGGMGWCIVYKFNFWVCFGDGDCLFVFICLLLKFVGRVEGINVMGGGMYLNFFDVYLLF